MRSCAAAIAQYTLHAGRPRLMHQPSHWVHNPSLYLHILLLQVDRPFELECVRHGVSEDPGPVRYMQDASLVVDDLAAACAAMGCSTQDWPKVTALYAVSTLLSWV